MYIAVALLLGIAAACPYGYIPFGKKRLPTRHVMNLGGHIIQRDEQKLTVTWKRIPFVENGAVIMGFGVVGDKFQDTDFSHSTAHLLTEMDMRKSWSSIWNSGDNAKAAVGNKNAVFYQSSSTYCFFSDGNFFT